MIGLLGSKTPSTGNISNKNIKKIDWALENRAIDQA